MIRTNFAQKEKLASADLNAAFEGLKGIHSTDNLSIFNEIPSNVSVGVFQTAFPYLPGSLRVYVGQTISGPTQIGMTRQVKDKDYQETKIVVTDAYPQRISFLTSP